MRHMLVRQFVVVALLLWGASAQAQLTIEITRGVDNPTPIAIVPMGWNGPALDEDISAIISANLLRSGLFDPLSRNDMLSFPTSGSDVHFRDWRVLGTEYLLVGNIEQRGDRYHVSFELFDVLGQSRLMARQTIDGSAGQLRDIAHTISDRIYETLTGVRGAFATEIVFVEAFHEEGTAEPSLYRLMLADADGARPRMLLESSEPILSPAWSPDGERIAYVSFETSRPAIFVQDLATGERQQITDFQGLNGAPAWSPDGTKLAMVLSRDGNPEIYTIDVRTRELTRITNHFAIDTEPSWTPDGKGIIFTSNRGGRPQIYQVTLANGRVERLTFEGNFNASARLTADGKHMVMVHQRGGVFHIAVQDLETGVVRILSETDWDESPTIAPNGAMLMYATRQNGKGILAAVSLDAGTRFRLPSEQGDVREPAWSPYFD